MSICGEYRGERESRCPVDEGVHRAMRQRAYIVGAGMTCFGRFTTRGLKSLASEAVRSALEDAGLELHDVQAAYMGTAAAGVMTGQVLIPGEVVLRSLGCGRIPVINVENACATSATAFHQAATMITLGAYDVVLVAGYEKLYHSDKAKTFAVFTGAVDVENIESIMRDLEESGGARDGAGSKRSLFMDLYARMAREHMQRYGSTSTHFAMVAAKNARHGSLNPKAQFREPLSVEDVLNAPLIAAPLTLPMCCPIGDGAAAVVLVSERKVRELGLARAVRIRSSVLMTGWDRVADEIATVPEVAAQLAYEEAGIGAGDLDVVELHDATAPAELMYYEYLGLAPHGEGARLIESGHTAIGGAQPVNPSGGLLRKGHPIGASGAAQLVELVTQLRGEGGARQVQGAHMALAENGGGFIGQDVAAIVISVLESAA